MSKEKPEVGDVFKVYNFYLNTTYKYYITGFYDNFVETVYLWEHNGKQMFQGVMNYKKEDFDKMIYLGKSKVNINDLFKTENE